ncbi:MAG TPA: YCF48-related protein [Pyrinomonadaceae bacterium]|nr:YCF48-related protein [Pyrinomonadaceae bacterium]
MRPGLPKLGFTISLAILIAVSAGSLVSHSQSGWTSSRVTSGGRDLNTVYFIDSKHGWVGGDGGFLAFTDDGGANWVERRLGTDRAINDVYFVSKDHGVALTGGSIFETSDGGHGWIEAHKFAPAEFAGATPELYSLRFNGRKRGWVVGSASRGDVVTDSILAVTRDSGVSWQVLRAPSQRELIHIDVVDDRRAWIVGAGGAILHTEDEGETWSRQNSGTTVTLFHIDFRNAKDGWAVGERGTIIRTENGGETWTKINSPTRATLLSVQFVSQDEGWIVGRGGVILRSSDRGATWVEEESGTKQNLYALFVDKKYGWAVGGNGLVLKYER